MNECVESAFEGIVEKPINYTNKSICHDFGKLDQELGYGGTITFSTQIWIMEPINYSYQNLQKADSNRSPATSADYF